MAEPMEDVIRAAVAVVVTPVLQLLQDDPHSWSDRGCQTCRAIGAIVGKEFGCYVYARQKAARRA